MNRDRAEAILPPEVAIPVFEGREFLPDEAPEVPELEFTGAGEGWPPRPRDQEEVRELEVEPIPGGLTDALEEEIRSAAINDRRVQEMLGERSVHLTTDMRRWGKGRRPDPGLPLDTRLLFFSHTNNVAVEVLMAGLTTCGARTRPGFQPPEVPEEVEEAVALARAHPAISDLVQDLEAGALLLPFRDGDLGYGHRILWVTFCAAGETEDEKPALFSAAVDLTDKRVLIARPEPPIERPRTTIEEVTNA
jgi:hypothetical protein